MSVIHQKLNIKRQSTPKDPIAPLQSNPEEKTMTESLYNIALETSAPQLFWNLIIRNKIHVIKVTCRCNEPSIELHHGCLIEASKHLSLSDFPRDLFKRKISSHVCIDEKLSICSASVVLVAAFRTFRFTMVKKIQLRGALPILMPLHRETVTLPFTSDKQQDQQPDPQRWRDLSAFWLFGFCNNIAFMALLSASHDIIQRFSKIEIQTTGALDSSRHCNVIGTGTTLVVSIVPAILIKLVITAMPMWINYRQVVQLILNTSAFILIAYAETRTIAFLGFVCHSLGSGLGETTYLSFSSRFDKNVLSTFASGTGFAAITGTLAYAGLRSLGVSLQNFMLMVVAVPCIEGAAFWLLLRSPQTTNGERAINEKPLQGFKEKALFTLSLYKFFIPLFIAFALEYFINQGLQELVNFKGIFLTQAEQFRWQLMAFQIGVCISRSTVNVVHIRRLWLLPTLQVITVAYFLTEVIFSVTPSIWITFAVALWAGLLSGAAFVNTFYKMHTDVPADRQMLAIAIVSIANVFGVLLAAFIAIPTHNWICQLPESQRLTF